MRGLAKRCAILFFLGFLIDLLQTFHIQACADRRVALSVSTVVAVYLVGFFGHDWFVQQQSSWNRFWLTLSIAIGAGCGTAVVMFFGER